MAHPVEHLEEKIACGKAIQEALNNVKLPEGYVINVASITLEYKPQTLIVAQVYLNKKPKGQLDLAFEFR